MSRKTNRNHTLLNMVNKRCWLLGLKITYRQKKSLVDPRADPNAPEVTITEERNDVYHGSLVEYFIQLLQQYDAVILTMATPITLDEAKLLVEHYQKQQAESAADAPTEAASPAAPEGSTSGLKLVQGSSEIAE